MVSKNQFRAPAGAQPPATPQARFASLSYSTTGRGSAELDRRAYGQKATRQACDLALIFHDAILDELIKAYYQRH